ncbi:hypothetical protein V6Z11_D09G234900 [Gossypium hirsutum]
MLNRFIPNACLADRILILLVQLQNIHHYHLQPTKPTNNP